MAIKYRALPENWMQFNSANTTIEWVLIYYPNVNIAINVSSSYYNMFLLYRLINWWATPWDMFCVYSSDKMSSKYIIVP